MEQSELAAKLVSLAGQLEKVKTEINAKLDAMAEAMEAADDVSPEVEAAFEAVKTAVQGIDDINPDAPVEPPTEPTI